MSVLAHLTPQLDVGRPLSSDEIAASLGALLDPGIAEDAKSEFLTALSMKGETAEEIAGFALELRLRAVDPGLRADRLLDIVGTGGDMAGTFNVSSCAMFIAAAAGVPVAKHGNRAITSQCGSADVLTALGAKIDLPPEAARRCFEATGMTFLFAPLYHPAFKVIAPVRKKLARRTIFNMLGPLVNPARPTHQLVGVFDRALVPQFAQVLRLLGLKRFLVVHGDGLDELTPFGTNTFAGIDGLAAPTLQRFNASTLHDLSGGDASTCSRILRDVLSGKERGARRDIVLLNAAAALIVSEKATDLTEGTELATELIDSGRALKKLEAFISATNQSL
jgi:anthranilate phosphoribosyltransferase